MGKSSFISKVALGASFLALVVIALGAFTRLIDAGLGCPDWPGCYGHLTVSGAEQAGAQLVAYKAWAEMMHRYGVAGLSGFIVCVVLIIFSKKALRNKANVILAVFLLLLLIYQILLGSLTVTLKLLPIIVSQHLLGGFFILSTLWLIYLHNKPVYIPSVGSKEKKLFPWAMLALILVLLQISLGAWTSTHYASLSCPAFPLCMNTQVFTWHFKEAFQLFSPVGINYEGGVLPEALRQTIQMTHRLGALILTTYLVILMMVAIPILKRSARLMQSIYLIFGLLILQLCMGISNVIFKLPLIVAMSHNIIAVLLLLAVITFTYQLATIVSKENLA